jgi:hypothetical protein
MATYGKDATLKQEGCHDYVSCRYYCPCAAKQPEQAAFTRQSEGMEHLQLSFIRPTEGVGGDATLLHYSFGIY